MTTFNHVKFGIKKDFINEGYSIPFVLDFKSRPHLAIFGSTGSGKTYASKLLLGKISKFIKDSEFIICDYKGDSDFDFLLDKNNFYRFEQVPKGIDKMIEILEKRQKKEDESRNFVLLFFDEWASFLNSLSKKESDLYKSKLSMLLMLGRSFNLHVIISQQRSDAIHFGTARDNFSVVITLGSLSKESIQMLFSQYKNEITPNQSIGNGYILEDGKSLNEILIPKIKNMTVLEKEISMKVL